MIQIEKSAKTITEAIELALKELGTTLDNIDYEVLEHGAKGFLGIGSKEARVLVKLKSGVSDSASQEDSDLSFGQNSSLLHETRHDSVKNSENSENSDVSESSEVSETISEMKCFTEEEIQKQSEFIISFLSELLRKMNFEAQVHIHFDGDSFQVDIQTEDSYRLIGKQGQTLDSLQYVLMSVLHGTFESHARVYVDTEHYREKRRQSLENLARKLAEKVKKTRKTVVLDPMNPYERSIIHKYLQNYKGIVTKSKGVEPNRKIFIYYNNRYK